MEEIMYEMTQHLASKTYCEILKSLVMLSLDGNNGPIKRSPRDLVAKAWSFSFCYRIHSSCENSLYNVPQPRTPSARWLVPIHCLLSLQNFELNTPFILKQFDLSISLQLQYTEYTSRSGKQQRDRNFSIRYIHAINWLL